MFSSELLSAGERSFLAPKVCDDAKCHALHPLVYSVNIWKSMGEQMDNANQRQKSYVF
jgi:hypothetical protein